MGKTHSRNLRQQNKKSQMAKEEVATKHKPSPKPNEKLRSFSKIQGKWWQCHSAPADPVNLPLT